MRSNNLLYMPGANSQILEIVVIQMYDFAEILQAIQAIRESKIVLLRLSELEPNQAQRAADIVTGGTFAIDGHTRWVGEQTFLFTPNGISISIIDNNKSQVSWSI